MSVRCGQTWLTRNEQLLPLNETVFLEVFSVKKDFTLGKHRMEPKKQGAL